MLTECEQPLDRLLRPCEVRRALGICNDTIEVYIEAGHLKPVRLPSGHRRFKRSEVEGLVTGEGAGAT